MMVPGPYIQTAAPSPCPSAAMILPSLTKRHRTQGTLRAGGRGVEMSELEADPFAGDEAGVGHRAAGVQLHAGTAHGAIADDRSAVRHCPVGARDTHAVGVAEDIATREVGDRSAGAKADAIEGKSLAGRRAGIGHVVEVGDQALVGDRAGLAGNIHPGMAAGDFASTAVVDRAACAEVDAGPGLPDDRPVVDDAARPIEAKNAETLAADRAARLVGEEQRAPGRRSRNGRR